MSTDNQPTLIPFVGVNLSRVVKIRDSILEKTRNHYNTEPTGEAFDTFVQDVFSALPTNIRYDVIYSSIMDMVGKQLTRETIGAMAWRLAGNMADLKKGIPSTPWTHQTKLEWCPIEIMSGNPGLGYDKVPGFFYEYVVLAGQASGKRFTLFWSDKFLRRVARQTGFRRRRKLNLKIRDGIELVRMRLYQLFDPALSKDDKPGAYYFYVPPSCLKDNKIILDRRFRLTPCQLDFTFSEQACHKCPMGYDKCIAGCHPATYVIRPCARCGLAETWFNPVSRDAVCVGCATNNRYVN